MQRDKLGSMTTERVTPEKFPDSTVCENCGYPLVNHPRIGCAFVDGRRGEFKPWEHPELPEPRFPERFPAIPKDQERGTRLSHDNNP